MNPNVINLFKIQPVNKYKVSPSVMPSRTAILQFERYLKKKKQKEGNSAHGYERGQRELLVQILKRLKKIKKKNHVK